MGRETKIVRPILIVTTGDLHGTDDYTASMLQIDPATMTGYPRLHLRAVRATAYIDHRSWHLRGIDWQLWVERNGKMTSAKCPLRLEIESRLRSWLLRVSGMPLHTLTYTQLRLITEGKIAKSRAENWQTLEIATDLPCMWIRHRAPIWAAFHKEGRGCPGRPSSAATTRRPSARRYARMRPSAWPAPSTRSTRRRGPAGRGCGRP